MSSSSHNHRKNNFSTMNSCRHNNKPECFIVADKVSYLIPGPTGTGPGPVGPIGPTGSNGTNGSTGLNGPRNPFGQTGSMGPMGITGPPSGITGTGLPDGINESDYLYWDVTRHAWVNESGFNIHLGRFSLENNLLTNTGTTGNNTAIGADTLQVNTTGFSNVAIGSAAMLLNTTGNTNVAIGTSTLIFNNSSSNTAVGAASIGSGNDNSNSTLGFQALNGALFGPSNTAVGYEAFFVSQTANKLTGIGNHVGATAISFLILITNSTAVGNEAIVNQSNQIVLGNTFITSLECNAPLTGLSDGRVKTDINEDIKGMEFIRLLRPISYKMSSERLDQMMKAKTEVKKNEGCASKSNFDNTICNGLIAQEVKLAAEESQYKSFSGVQEGNENELWRIIMTDFVPSLIKSIQELEMMNEQLRERISLLEKEE
jgi:hypothetical protein